MTTLPAAEDRTEKTGSGGDGPYYTVSIAFRDRIALVDRTEIEARSFSYFNRERPEIATGWHFHKPLSLDQSLFVLDEKRFRIAWERLGEEVLRDIWHARTHPDCSAPAKATPVPRVHEKE